MKLKAKVKNTRKASSGLLSVHYLLGKLGLNFDPSQVPLVLSAMMSCWRGNTFEDTACKKEIDRFLQCAAKVVCYKAIY